MVSQPSVRDVGSMSRDELAECISKELTNGLGDISRNLEPSKIRKLVIREHTNLKAALSTDDWIGLLPGKLIFNRFCGDFFSIETARVREAYADIAMRIKPDVFADITQIFEEFSQVVAPSEQG